MKRIAILCMMIACALSASGQVSGGLILRSHLSNYSQKTDAPTATENSTSAFSLDIGPIVRFMVSSKAEVAPYIGFSLYNTSTKNPAGQTTSSNNSGMFMGCGFYFFLAENSVFKFSLGPRVNGSFWFTRTQVTADVDLPLNFDFLVGGPWSIRASASVIDFMYMYSKNGGTHENDFNYSMLSNIMPELSFFVTF
jgi:hypothetical protein